MSEDASEVNIVTQLTLNFPTFLALTGKYLIFQRIWDRNRLKRHKLNDVIRILTQHYYFFVKSE